MATSITPNNEIDMKENSMNLELVSIVWLDDNDNNMINQIIQEKLRSIINHIIKFHDIKECQQYIEQQSKDHRLVVVVNDQQGKVIVPTIHILRQISSIFIYCTDKKGNQRWISKYPKIKAIVTKPDELISQIQTNYKIQKKVEEPLSINIFTTNTNNNVGKATTGVNGQFVFSQVLIDCILRMKSNQSDKNELISCCINQYLGNKDELNNLREFRESYSSKNALWWYTRESFFYKTLNAALRTQNIHMIFLFRSYIADIYRQLQEYQTTHLSCVYRSQFMSNDEFEVLKQWPGQFISINSFFSTSTNRSMALSFLNNSTPSDMKRILFEIHADPQMVTTKPFADITMHSYFPNEDEVLFMFGSIFRLNSIHLEEENLWIIQMDLCSDDDTALKQVLLYRKSQNGVGETNLRTLGKILTRMGKFDLAEKYFLRFIHEFPPNHPFLVILYDELAEVTAQNGQYDKSMEWENKAIKIKEQIQPGRNINAQKANKILVPHIPAKTKWMQMGITVAGGHGNGDKLNQLNGPIGLFIDKNRTITIADCLNNRIVEWRNSAASGRIVAGGHEAGRRTDQLNGPTDVIIDNENLIISDSKNEQVIRWPHRNGKSGEVILSDLVCQRLTLDSHGFIYVSNSELHEVRRYRLGDTVGTIVAGGNGAGDDLDQLHWPTFIFVDEDQSIYVSDNGNHRVMMWKKNAKEGIIVAGGRGQGDKLTQLSNPDGLIVDSLGNIYVADNKNHRVMRFYKGIAQGTIISGGYGSGNEANQLQNPQGLSFDEDGNLYVVDWGNHRVQRFDIEQDDDSTVHISHTVCFSLFN